MKTGRTDIVTRNRNIFLIALVTALILLVPLVAMQFIDQVIWSPADFIAAAALIFGTGLAYELVTRKNRNTPYRGAAGLVLAAVLFIVWAQLAVGIWN